MSDLDLIVRPLQELTGTQSDSVRQLVTVSAGLAQLFARMDARMTALEQERTGATILHKDALMVARRIRERASADADKYGLPPVGEKALRAMLKRQTLKRYGITDLHDLPRARMEDALRYIDNAPTYGLVLKVREKIGT